jgi:Tetratricopeptide repeat
VAPLPTGPAGQSPTARAGELPTAAPASAAPTPVDPLEAAAPRVMPWPLSDSPLAPSHHVPAAVAYGDSARLAPAPAAPASPRHHTPAELGPAPLAPSLLAAPWRMRALLLPGAIAIAAAFVVARLQPATSTVGPHSAPLALEHVVTVEYRGPRSAEPPRPQTLLDAFQHGPAALPPRETEPVALVEAARRALAEGRPGDAHTLASRAAQRDPYSPHGFAVLAEAELALGAPERALEAALASAKLRPKRVRYQHLLARVYGALGRTDDAREAQRLAELLAPSDPDVRAMERAAQRAQQR